MDERKTRTPSKSRTCTTDLLEYLRFFRGHKIVATEVAYNFCKSDVLSMGPNDDKVYEYEVKVSKADFNKDFSKVLGNKRYGAGILKHASYNDPQTRKFTPDYFWFVLPKELAGYALEKLEDYPRYGLIEWEPEGESFFSPRNSYNTKITVVKKARALPKGKTIKGAMDRVKRKIIHRATSEMVKNRMKEI